MAMTMTETAMAIWMVMPLKILLNELQDVRRAQVWMKIDRSNFTQYIREARTTLRRTGSARYVICRGQSFGAKVRKKLIAMAGRIAPEPSSIA